jgi:hypothetical protein
MSELRHQPTPRGFDCFEFDDRYGVRCTLQKSSLATEDAVWFGVNDASPKIMASQAAAHGVQTRETCGWVPYPVPDDVLLTTRMHLTREQVAALLPLLQHFADTGELPKEPK